MRRALGFTLLCLSCAPLEAGAYVMTDAGARAALDSWAFSGSSLDSNQLVFSGSPADHVYESFGYLGNASGVVRVTPASFDELVPIGGAGNTASSQLVLGAAGAAALGLAAGDITLDYAFALSDAARSFVWDIAVTNASLATLDLVFYAYFDFDLEGDFGNDLATGGVTGFQLTDGTTGFAFDAGSSTAAAHYQLAAYPNVQAALDAMLTTGAADLPDATAGFGPGDFTGALQFDFSLVAGDSEALGVTLIPEPATAIQLALGLLGLAFAGRKRA
jgi:hypothetical protein